MSSDANRQSVIIHAGFHKTGTTSVQAMIERERDRLSDYANFYVKGQIGPARDIARRYGQFPNRYTLKRFADAFEEFLNKCPSGKPIVISRETLSGAMLTGEGRWPFRRDRYKRISLNLARVMVQAAQNVFGPEVQVTLLYTTRDDAGYLRSVYGHMLRDSELTESFEEFQQRFRHEINLQKTANKISKALPKVNVVTASLAEISQSARGPGQIILDVLNIPNDLQAQIKPPIMRNNPGISDELADQLLQLNQTDMRSRDRTRAKKELVMAERKALHGWWD